MKTRILISVSLLLLLPGMFGCSRFSQTYQTEIVKGETFAGEEVGDVYQVTKQPGADGLYLLSRQPYCAEEMEEVALVRERSQDVRGAAAVALAPLGIVFPRIGQPLIFRGLSKSRGAEKEAVGALTTGRIIPCGEWEPAANVPFVVQTSDGDILKGFRTDDHGLARLDTIIAAAANSLYVNVFVDNREAVFFIGTVHIR